MLQCLSVRRLKLRSDVSIGPLTLNHAPNMLSWMLDPEVSANIGLTRAPTLERTRTWIENALLGESIWPYAIFLNAAHVGNVVLDQADRHLGSARVSVYVGASEARGAGVGLTGMYHALGKCFLDHGLHKVWLTVHARNAPAIHTYVALGFQIEGVLRDGFLLDGERLPALYMGLLKEDFLKIETELP
jgi:RimJ/RimL family protein N-acetyltransferase